MKTRSCKVWEPWHKGILEWQLISWWYVTSSPSAPIGNRIKLVSKIGHISSEKRSGRYQKAQSHISSDSCKCKRETWYGLVQRLAGNWCTGRGVDKTEKLLLLKYSAASKDRYIGTVDQSVIYRPNSFILIQRHCVNLKAIGYESRVWIESQPINRIV